MKRKKNTTEQEPPASPPLPEPSPYEIAKLAAALIRPEEKLDSSTMRRAASLAVSLWNASEVALQQRKESKEGLALIALHQSKVPTMPEWEKVEKKDRKPATYDRGLEVLFPHHRADHRDSMMLDFLKYMARSAADGESLGRDNWKRIKQEGFHPGEFNRLAFYVPEWLRVRHSLVNTENAKLRKK